MPFAEQQLYALGIYTFAQISQWDDATISAVAEALGELSTDRAREAFLLQEFGFTQREIAEQLGLPDAKSVENLIGYQHKRIRRHARSTS